MNAPASGHRRSRLRALWLAAALVLLAAPGGWAQPPSGAAQAGPRKAAAERDGQRDFDFEFGAWRVRIRRLLHPLSGSHQWVELEGTSVVRRVWDGRANLGELEVGSPTMRIEGMSLRLYNPGTRRWSIYWASSRDGSLGVPMIGRFEGGRGEFYDQEMFGGRAVFVRFIFSDITATSFRLEQAFSADGGRSWEANWIASFARST
jgi:hypothetical protein